MPQTSNKLGTSTFASILSQSIFWLVFTIPLFFNPLGYFPFETTKIATMYLFVGLLLLIAALVLIRKSSFDFFINKKITLILGAFTSVVVLSNLLSSSPVESFWGSYSHLQGSLYYLFSIIWFIACLQIFQDKSNREIFYKITCLVALPIALFALTQALHIPGLDYGSLAEFTFRPISTIGNPTMLGQWLIFPIIIAFFQIQKKDKWRLLYISVFSFLIIALLLTQNRASILALLIVGIIIAYNKIKNHRHKQLLIIGSIFALSITAILLFSVNSRSILSRTNLLQSSASYLLQSPPLGRGLETLTQTSHQFVTPQIFETEPLFSNLDRLHNQPLQILNDWGWIGLILFIYLAVEIFRRRSHSAEFYLLIASSITLLFSFSFSGQQIYLLAALAISCHQQFKIKKQIINFSLPLRVLSFSVLTLVFLFSAAYSFLLNQSNYLLAKSDQLYLQNAEAAAEKLAAARQTIPVYRFLHDRYWQLYSDRSSAEYLKNLLAEYGQYFNDKHALIYEASIDYKTGNFDSGNRKFAEAQSELSTWPFFWQSWGDQEFENKRYPQAIYAFEQLEKLSPSYLDNPSSEQTRIFKKTTPQFYLSLYKLVLAYKETGQIDEARQVVQKYFPEYNK